MSIAAIPTVYKGIQYRSRLEARWAAFFNLLGWEAQYEPFDAAGYIPDFLIKSTVFEIKPTKNEEEVRSHFNRYERHAPRSGADAEKLGYDQFIISLASPMKLLPQLPCCRVVGFDPMFDEPAVVVPLCDGVFNLGVFSRSMEFLNTSVGHLSIKYSMGEEIDDLWARACNITQWRGVQNNG